jgi:hypothetical protein
MVNVCDKHFTENDGNMVRNYFIQIARESPSSWNNIATKTTPSTSVYTNVSLISNPLSLPLQMKQTNCTPNKGNALQICVSALFNIVDYVNIVPNFIEDPKGYEYGIQEYVKTINYTMKKIKLNNNNMFLLSDDNEILELPTLCILRGKSPRGEHGHVVVANIKETMTFDMVFDPHPDNTFLDTNESFGWVMVFFKTTKGTPYH